MRLRLAVLILLLLNCAAAALAVWRAHAQRPLVTARLPGVPELRLLRDAMPVAPASAVTARAAAVATTAQCLDLGPFTTQAEMHQAFAALAPRVPRIQYSVAESAVSRGWWVYLAAPSRAQALVQASALAARGLHDYYVITAGDRQNSISLGLFQEPANAQRRLAQVRALGFPAQLRQRVEQVPQYHIEFQLPATPGFAWQALVAHPNILDARPRACD